MPKFFMNMDILLFSIGIYMVIVLVLNMLY